MTAGLYTLGTIITIDKAESRLAQGARVRPTYTIDNSRDDPVNTVMDPTDGMGADVAIKRWASRGRSS